MKRIEQSPNKSLAFNVLKWIVYAVRPLKLDEVLHAIAIDDLEPEDESVTEDCLTPPSTIVNACAGMIRIDKESDVISLVHKTTQEYFDKHGINHFPFAHRDIMTSCLKYLSLHIFSSGPCPSYELFERRLKKNALLDERITSSASQVLFYNAPWRFRYGPFFQGVHFAAYFGLTGILKLLLDTGKAEVDSKDNCSQTPLSWAVDRGHKAIVELLLKTGKAEVNSKDNHDRTPLSLAAIEGHEAVVKLLLDIGKAEVNSKDKDSRTPLLWAAIEGIEATVKLLLDTGKAEVNSKDKDSQTPLSWATTEGHEGVVKLLLKTCKAEVDSKDNYDRTPLSWAAARGHEAIVELLLKIGKPDIDSIDIKLL